MTKATVLPLLAFLLILTSALSAQTFESSTGTVNPQTVGYLTLDAGGSAVVAAGMADCSFVPAGCGFTSGTVSYVLPSGTTASLSGFVGNLTLVSGSQNNGVWRVAGSAHGLDSTGLLVTAQAEFSFYLVCKSGRGGGCKKTFLSGELVVNP